MAPTSDNTDALLRKAEAGDEAAKHQLLERHRDRLRRMIAVRMDHRLKKRTLIPVQADRSFARKLFLR